MRSKEFAAKCLRRFRNSRRGIEVLTGNLMMIMVMMAVFSSIAFIVKSSSDKYARIQEQKMVEGISAYLSSKVSETWGVVSDEIPLNLPELIGGGDYVIQMDPSGNYLIVRTRGGTYRIKSSGIRISSRSISSSQVHTIGIREGEVVIDPPPLVELTHPLDGAVFSSPFNLSYRTSRSADEHIIYLDGRKVASSSSTLDGFTIDPDTSPTNLTDGQHTLTVLSRNPNGEGADSVRFVVDRTPPTVQLNMSLIMTGDLRLTVSEVVSYKDKVEIYVFVTDGRLLPVRGLDAEDFYVYNDASEFASGGRLTQLVSATDSESRIDPHEYEIHREYQGLLDVTHSKDGRWDSKTFNGTVTFWAAASDIAGNSANSPNITKFVINRALEVGVPDRKSDLSVIFTNDVSGSMDWVMWKDEDPKPGEESRLDFMKAAVKRFVEKMFPGDEAAICSFATNYAAGGNEIILQADFTATNDAGKTSLYGVVDGLNTRDGTPLYDALYKSVLWIENRTKYRAVLVLTDGKDLNYATGKPYSTHTAVEVIDLAREAGIPIYCVGLGEEDRVDVGVLNAISDQTEARFYLAPTAERLTEAYDQIAGELLSGYKVTYWPGYEITGGEKIILAAYDEDDRSGSLEIELPVPTAVENLAPIVSVTTPNGGETVSSTTPISWTAADPEGDPLTFDLYYSRDAGGSWSWIASGAFGLGPAHTYNWDTIPSPNGNQYLVRVVAYDGENQGSDESDAVFTVDNLGPDTTDPMVSITKPTYPPTKKIGGTYTFEGMASDSGGSGLDRVEIYIGGSLKGLATLLPADKWEFPFDTTTMPNGVYAVEARAYDGAGNSAQDTSEAEITN